MCAVPTLTLAPIKKSLTNHHPAPNEIRTMKSFIPSLSNHPGHFLAVAALTGLALVTSASAQPHYALTDIGKLSGKSEPDAYC